MNDVNQCDQEKVQEFLRLEKVRVNKTYPRRETDFTG